MQAPGSEGEEEDGGGDREDSGDNSSTGASSSGSSAEDSNSGCLNVDDASEMPDSDGDYQWMPRTMKCGTAAAAAAAAALPKRQRVGGGSSSSGGAKRKKSGGGSGETKSESNHDRGATLSPAQADATKSLECEPEWFVRIDDGKVTLAELHTVTPTVPTQYWKRY